MSSKAHLGWTFKMDHLHGWVGAGYKQGIQLGLSTGVPMCNFPKCTGILRAYWLDFKSKYSKKQKLKVSSLLRLWSEIKVTFTIFYCSSCHRAHPQSRKEDIDSHISKDFWLIWICHRIILILFYIYFVFKIFIQKKNDFYNQKENLKTKKYFKTKCLYLLEGKELRKEE